jgi:hypothetical protein|tara:strand:+ start:683 stop:1099 length:417 start_codon:yes stop_codon:yes gene_type:complete
VSHFAKVVDGIVEQVIVAEQDFINAHCGGTWVQTSYNTRGGLHYTEKEVTVTYQNPEGVTVTEISLDSVADGEEGLRKNFACVGFTYDAGQDAFYAPQPYASWTLNDDTYLWEAPTAYPDDGNNYNWDEDTTSWVEVE